MRTMMNTRYIKNITKLDENYTKSHIIIWIFHAICDQVKHPSEIPPEWQTFFANSVWIWLAHFYYVMKNTITLFLCILFWQATLISHFWWKCVVKLNQTGMWQNTLLTARFFSDTKEWSLNQATIVFQQWLLFGHSSRMGLYLANSIGIYVMNCLDWETM